MISEKIKVTRKEKAVMKQTKNVLKLIEQYKRSGLLSKEKALQYKEMIDKDVEVCENAKKEIKTN